MPKIMSALFFTTVSEKPHHRLNVGMRYSIELVEVQLELRANVNVCTLVLSAVTVLWCREDSDTAAIVLDLVSLHPDLVTSDNGFKTVVLAEALGNVGSELETNTTLAWTSARGGLRIGPEHLHHQATLTGLALLVPVKLPDIVESDLVVGEQTAVKDKVLVSDESCEGQSGEGLREELEDTLVVLGLAFTLETVHSVHVVGLVVSAVQEHGLGVEPLVSVEKQCNLA